MREIKLIDENLRSEEIIHQISDALEALTEATEEIFNAIDCKVSQFQSRLQQIDNQTAVVTQKIDLVRQRGNKATRVFSVNKYPKNNLRLPEYQPLLSLHELKIRREQKPKLSSQHHIFDDHSLESKQKFFTIKASCFCKFLIL